jgi:hypothetical protein
MLFTNLPSMYLVWHSLPGQFGVVLLAYTLKNLIILGLLLLCVSACQKYSAPLASNTNAPAASPTAIVSQEEPLWERSPETFRQTWATFTKGGRFRMALTNEVGGMPYHYSFANDVLVIVVDQTATHDSHLKLAYFKAPDYQLFWVDHNFNLAISRVSNASSDLVVYEGGDPATRSAFLKWDAKRQTYTCLAT